MVEAVLSRLIQETEQALARGAAGSRGGGLIRAAQGRRRERADLEALRQAAGRWSEELRRVRRGYEEILGSQSEGREREEHLEGLLDQKEAELRALRGAAAGRELDLQREHDAESRHQQEEIASLKKRLSEAESGKARDEELREVKRRAYERERELRRANAEKLSETEQDTQRRVSAIRAQRESDNRSLVERHAFEKARLDEELKSLSLRQGSEARAYVGRIEELARERSEERTSLEEAVAKLREKHEAERSRLQERAESLEESLKEQESITLALLGELGYLHGAHTHHELSGSSPPTGELEVAQRALPRGWVQDALRELREAAPVGDLLREGLALFNESEHVKVVSAICKSLGEPEIHASLDSQSSGGTTSITLLWSGMSWRRYVSEPRASGEPKVYLAAYGDGGSRPPLPDSGPNARLDARGLLSLGVRPL